MKVLRHNRHDYNIILSILWPLVLFVRPTSRHLTLNQREQGRFSITSLHEWEIFKWDVKPRTIPCCGPQLYLSNKYWIMQSLFL
jgi:hypothetical protein